MPHLDQQSPSFSFSEKESANTMDGVEVVVVDDSPVMLQLIQAALRPLADIHVSAFDDPFAAYSHVESHDKVGCVVTDFRMPEMNGRELAEAIHTDSPALPVICVSGFDLGDSDTTCFVHLMEKPFKPEDLQRAVIRHLSPTNQSHARRANSIRQ